MFEAVQHLLEQRGDAGEYAELSLESHDGLGESEKGYMGWRGVRTTQISGATKRTSAACGKRAMRLRAMRCSSFCWVKEGRRRMSCSMRERVSAW